MRQASFIDQAAWVLMSAAVQEQKDRLARLQLEAKSKHRHAESHILQASSQDLLLGVAYVAATTWFGG